MNILVNYANEKYKKTQKVNSWTGKHIAGFDKIYSFGPEDIDIEYRKMYSDILDNKRGDGLWLWKPYFINKVLQEAKEGDIIFYVDSGAFFVSNVKCIIKSFRQNEKIWVSDCPLLENCFTKEKCFELMECNDDSIKYSNQIQGCFFFAVCCDESKKFVEKWLKYCEDFRLMSPEGTFPVLEYYGNKFVAHREDQSILSLLCKKEGIVPHRDPSQRGKIPETFYDEHYSFRIPEHDDTYGVFVFIHKSPTASILDLARLLFRTIRAKVRYKKKINLDRCR